MMEIRDVEIDCDECRRSINITDRCYCEECVDKKDDKIAKLEDQIKTLEADIESYEHQITAMMAD